MQILDEAVELPRDLISSITSRRIPDTDNLRDATGAYIRCQAKSRIAAGNTNVRSLLGKNISVGDWRRHPYECGLKDL
jgi:hypothetical protein